MMEKDNNWERLVALAVGEKERDDYFDGLMKMAEASSIRGVKSIDLPWDPNDELDSGGFVKLAMSLAAAAQNANDPKKAVLTTAQQERIWFVWQSVYSNSLICIGASNEPLPPSAQEAIDKQTSSLMIATLLQDSTRMSLSVLSGAWILERLGETEKSLSLRKTLGMEISWPPIRKIGNKYRVVLPEPDRK